MAALGAAHARFRPHRAVAAAAVVLMGFVPAPGYDRHNFCKALGTHVRRLQVITWDNGITSSGPAWGGVLDDGIRNADRPSRIAAAQAVRKDALGYQRLRSGARADRRAALDRLHALVLDPRESERRRDSAAVLRDIVSSVTVCGWAP